MAEPQPNMQLRTLVGSAQRAIAESARRPAFELPYTAPDLRPNPAVEVFDKVRAGLFALSGVLLLATSLAFGAGMDARSQASLLDTGLVHAVIWPVIGIALIASAAFSALPAQLSSRRQRAAGIHALSAAALMSCALTLASGFLPWTAAAVSAAAAGIALYGVHQLNLNTARNRTERIATDMPLGFFAGFALVYTLQLVSAAAGWNEPGHALAVSLVAVAAAVPAAVFAHSERGRHAFASGFGLALAAAAAQGWMLGATPLWACVLWVFLAIVVFVCAENRRFQISHAEHRVQAGRTLDF
ncbi:hypothetical protein GT020_07505 [Glutamicibacter soli]|uniref:Uncharacterized protein n=1 Tax=Glutamicibacter soli TaxID=453836 RepID=A0A6L9G273_9MICC|nr:hypothetical protein [Glutamicibacter soli]NAZ15912.1 hypothetical protein [Glutamicibacter soli]